MWYKNYLKRAKNANTIKSIILRQYREYPDDALEALEDALADFLYYKIDKSEVADLYYDFLAKKCGIPISDVVPGEELESSVDFFILIPINWSLLARSMDEASKIIAEKVFKKYKNRRAFIENKTSIEDLVDRAYRYLDTSIESHFEFLFGELLQNLCPSPYCGLYGDYFAIPLFDFKGIINLYDISMYSLDQELLEKYVLPVLEEFADKVAPTKFQEGGRKGSDVIDFDVLWSDFYDYIKVQPEVLFNILSDIIQQSDCTEVRDVVSNILADIQETFTANWLVVTFYADFVEYLKRKGYI